MDAHPVRRNARVRAAKERARVTTLNDLPLDVLCLILSMVVSVEGSYYDDFRARIRHPPLACKALAAAAARPSQLWEKVE